MARPVRVLGIALLALVTIAAITYAWKNPENKNLDAAARSGQPGQFVALSQGVTHYEINGPDTGRVIILAHGSSVPLYIWDSTAIALGNAGYRIIRYDRYGFGLSDRPDAAYDSTMFVKQIDELADSLHIVPPFDLMGLSFGGFVTAHYVKAHPEKVRTLTLVDPGASSVPMDASRHFLLTTPVLREWFTQVMIAPAAADGQPGDFLHPEHFPGWVDRYRPQMAYHGFGRALRRTTVAAAGTNYNALYATTGNAGIPVLLVWGRQDPVVPFTYADSVRRVIPAAEFMPVDSAGHLPHMEQSVLVRDRMLSFLSAHPGAPR